jgi:hypothetical protein
MIYEGIFNRERRTYGSARENQQIARRREGSVLYDFGSAAERGTP